jgi:MoxR-like ATPase
MPESQQNPRPNSELERLEFNSIVFALEAALALGGAARAYQLIGNRPDAVTAMEKALRLCAKIEARLEELPENSAAAERLRERLLHLKEKLARISS